MSQIPEISNMFNKLIDIMEIKPNGLYGQEVVLKSGDITIKNSDLDIEFDISFDDDTEANESEVVIYNLTTTTLNKLKKGQKVTLEAGYSGDTGIILSGYISKKVTKWEGVDKKTTLYIIDNNQLKEKKIKSISFKKGSKASYILKTLVDKVGLPVGVFKIKRDYTYKDKTTVDGGIMENIKKYAKTCGVSAYICKGKIYVRSLKDGDNIKFTVKPETGLLSIEEFEEEEEIEKYKDVTKGLNISMLLQHRITTASIIQVQSKNFKGTYRVRSGKHTYDGINFLTEIEVI